MNESPPIDGEPADAASSDIAPPVSDGAEEVADTGPDVGSGPVSELDRVLDAFLEHRKPTATVEDAVAQYRQRREGNRIAVNDWIYNGGARPW
jgi:hypothetical protein